MSSHFPGTAPVLVSPIVEQETLSAFVVLAMMLQAQVALAPGLPPRDVPLDDPELWLDEQWQKRADKWWEEQSAGLGEQLRELLILQVRARALRRGAPKADMEALLPDADPVVTSVSLMTDAGEQVPIPGFLALSHSQFDDEEPFILYGLGSVVWFDTHQRMVETLVAYLEIEGCWQQLITEQSRAALRDAASVELTLTPLEVSLEAYLLEEMRLLQRQLALKALAVEDDTGAAAVALEPLFEQLQGGVAETMRSLRKDLSPDWMRNLPPDDTEQLSVLDLAANEAEVQFAQQSGHTDFYDYARHRIGLWLTDQGFPGLEAEDVQLHIRHDFTQDAPVQVVSLLEWFCGGAYHGKRLAVTVQHEGLRDALGGAGVSTVADELQLHQGYVEQVERLYESEWIRHLLGKVLGARLQLARKAADFQGIDRKALALFEAAMQPSSEGTVNVALLSINREMLLTDHLYLYNDDIHVLYAPGSPAGDLQAFNSSGQMSFALGALTATPQGRAYLVEHVQHAHRPALARYLKLIARLPQEWSRETIKVHAKNIDGWDQLIQHWTDLRVLKILDDLEPVRPPAYDAPDEALQRRVVDIDHELRVLMTDYQAVAEVPTFMAYAREQVSERINRYPGNPGGWIDADTVQVELEDGVRQSLTQVVAGGYPANFNFKDFARISSTIGQDLSHLSNPLIDGYIRTARLGERYCAEIHRSYLGPDGEAQSRPLELHRHITGMKIQRDCLVALQSGRLSDDHAHWLKSVCMQFHQGSFVDDCKLAELKINGAGVPGGYLLQSSQAQGTLIYLSDGPEGGYLYTIGDFVGQWRGAAMKDWIYEHIATDDERLIRELYEEVRIDDANDDSGDTGNDRIAASLQVLHNIRDLSVALRQRIKRLLAEAQRDAYSVARRITQEVFWLVGLVADAVALAFPPARIVLGFIKAGVGLYRSIVALRDGDKTAALFALLKGVVDLPGFTGVLKFYGTRLFDQGSKLWSSLFPGPSSALSLWLKKQVQLLKALYEKHEMFLEAGGLTTKQLYGTFEQELAWYTQLSVGQQEPEHLTR
ncbi:hypothetical protein JYG34_21820 [Pseudomonas entomophila]|uniref:dermonecrotic toxin domain-containing protein n=1 Tax=Pseudomonas entomophila TaxID=312306 RepID=UPI001BCD4C48|nr:DUF6543 domain-containing protein [Pseudomonas entomophila]QVM90615.1 hypothetical protein JYG34_21820 [Pseudomonas entomophila]